jgi:hypothetical protein
VSNGSNVVEIVMPVPYGNGDTIGSVQFGLEREKAAYVTRLCDLFQQKLHFPDELWWQFLCSAH